jgi:hypothetical protein
MAGGNTLQDFGNFNPQQFFGTDPTQIAPTNKYGGFNRTGGEQFGSGLYGLPPAFSGWTGPARYAFAPAMQYSQQMQPLLDQQRQGMTKDWTKELFGQSSDIINAQQGDASAKRSQSLAQQGYGGGGQMSPFAGLQLEQESLARSGALGNAQRQAVLQSQQMQSQFGKDYQNSLATIMQAMLTPAQIQAGQTGKVPTSGNGPSLIGPGLSALGGLMNLGAAA